jgi:hypothetical protein
MIISMPCPTGTGSSFVRDPDGEEKNIQQGGNEFEEFEK